ncbi:hypothetical protein Ddye_010145 [Dipteronia dyeriana]|uniref:RNase H type-1 domain-containing protein n=1 Tax=Dipteronia dyeriana TaxID=168575 RepID=A0AAD9XD09_9ROSI|nr:hypothetical protein Ddye_010145 [Dipteronia dyeriana]
MLNKAELLELLNGAFFVNGEVHISHLQFADDMILFLEPKLEYLMNAKRILRCFELALGLKINFYKSCLVRVEKRGAREVDWAGKFRCIEASLPITYLGLPLGGNPSREAFWSPVVNKVEQMLAPWKRGGLGVGRMRDKVLSMMVKWAWRFGREDSSLWRKVLCAKYGLCSNALQLNGSKIKSGSHFVRSINKLLYGNHRAYDIVHNDFTVVIGNGEKILLWQEGICPPKIEIFAWQLLKGKILVREVLNSFGLQQVVCTDWPLCGGGGIGGVLRDSNDRILCLFSMYVGSLDAITAELYAIHKACLLIYEKESIARRRITIISYSKSAVAWVKGSEFGNLQLVHLVYDIRQFLKNSDMYDMRHMPRVSNAFTDSLAKAGSSGGDV